jgi:FSR family fosmidomycin resistance protein-like MFS transporter
MTPAHTPAALSLPPFLRDRRYLANAVGHAGIDVLTSCVSLMLALLSLPLGLSNTAIGLIATAFTFANALTQPLFGWLSDQSRTRRLAAGGAVWIAVFFALSALVSGRNPWLSIVFLVISALGSGAFHPEGAVNARRVPLAQITTATAVFFLFGQMGSGLGPSLAGGLVDAWGPAGLLFLAALTLMTGVWMWRQRPLPLHQHGRLPAAPRPAGLRLGRLSLVFFALLLFTRMTVQSTTVTFLPKHLQDLGWSASAYGVALSVVIIGGAIGNVVGGSLADRIGRWQVVIGSMFLTAPFVWLYLDAGGLAFYALLFLAGLCVTAGHSINVVMAQAMLPGRQGLASGLVLGFMFASGAVGAALAGWLGDRIGLAAVLQGLAWVAVIGGLFALALPRDFYRADAH